ncbi:MAG: hypothetical protein U0572_02360 [Phycisphaerales bacterium]
MATTLRRSSALRSRAIAIASEAESASPRHGARVASGAESSSAFDHVGVTPTRAATWSRAVCMSAVESTDAQAVTAATSAQESTMSLVRMENLG